MLDSSIRLLVLNGSGVIAHFENIAGVSLDARVTSDWALRRRTQSDVAGVAYQGTVSQLLGVNLKRDLLVVGFNHNIQSSFGVTREVRSSIRGWVGRLARQVLR